MNIQRLNAPPLAIVQSPSGLFLHWRRRGLIGLTVLTLHTLPLLALLNFRATPPRPEMAMVAVLPGMESETPAVKPVERSVVPQTRPLLPSPIAAAAQSRSEMTAAAKPLPVENPIPAPVATPSVKGPATPSVAGSGGESAPQYQAAYLHNPQPPYPLLSRKYREEGLVRLRVLVSAAGRAETVNILAGSGFTRLDEIARSTVQGWQFIPAQQQGQAVAGWVEVPIQFNLEK